MRSNHLKPILAFALALSMTLALWMGQGFAQGKTIELLKKNENGEYNKHGWNHYGPGYFILNPWAGTLESAGGMGLFWYAERKFKDFVLELEYMTANDHTNSGIFVRIPDVPSSNSYTGRTFEVQIDDRSSSPRHRTGAIYASNPSTELASNGPGKWNKYRITCQGKRIKVELNGKLVNDWMMEPNPKIPEFALDGYIGLQNHDPGSSIWYRNLRVTELGE